MNMTYNLGSYTSDSKDALRDNMVAEMVWLKTLPRIEFMDAVVHETTDALDHYLKFPKNQVNPTFKISEGTTAEFQTAGWFNKSFRLDKFRSKLQIDDESKVRFDEQTQWNYSLDMTARGMAEARDNEIMSTLYNAIGTSVDAGAYWSSSSSDLIGDIANLIGTIFEKDTTNLTEADIQNTVIYYPLKLWGHIRTPEMLMNPTAGSTAKQGRLLVDTSQYGWAGGEYNFKFVGSTKLNSLNEAIGVIRSPDTARHYSYTGSQIPTVETYRDADEGANTWLVTQLYKTFAVPQSYTQQDTNDRIMRIKSVSTSS